MPTSMPTFSTPTPIAISVEMGAGDVHVTTSDRTDTTVEVTPTNPAKDSDRKAAEQTTVDFSNGILQITAPRIKPLDGSRKTRSVQITIAAPAGSQIRTQAQAGNLYGHGVLGDVRVKTSAGDVQLDRSGSLDVHTSAGRVMVAAASGDVDVQTGSGQIRIGQVGGTAVVKSSNGTVELGSVAGTARLRSANGDITVDQPGPGVEAKTSNGSIRVGAASDGLFDLNTAMGSIDLEVARGVAAKLDMSTKLGRVHNGLDEIAGPPAASEKTIEVHAHTSFGSVSVRRAA